MSFKKNKYKIIRKVISKDMVNFIFDYFKNKRKVARLFFDSGFIFPRNESWGKWNDSQVPNTYCHYADLVFETVLERLTERMEKESGYKLIPTYSYARIYKKGDILARHTDRFSCEVSATLHIGGDTEWPIYLEPSGLTGKAGIKINMKPGDILIYKGCDLEHWREPYQGDNYCQGFLHYHDSTNKKAKDNKFDGRPFLGLSSEFKGTRIKETNKPLEQDLYTLK